MCWSRKLWYKLITLAMSLALVMPVAVACGGDEKEAIPTPTTSPTSALTPPSGTITGILTGPVGLRKTEVGLGLVKVVNVRNLVVADVVEADASGAFEVILSGDPYMLFGYYFDLGEGSFYRGNSRVVFPGTEESLDQEIVLERWQAPSVASEASWDGRVALAVYQGGSEAVFQKTGTMSPTDPRTNSRPVVEGGQLKVHDPTKTLSAEEGEALRELWFTGLVRASRQSVIYVDRSQIGPVLEEIERYNRDKGRFAGTIKPNFFIPQYRVDADFEVGDGDTQMRTKLIDINSGKIVREWSYSAGPVETLRHVLPLMLDIGRKVEADLAQVISRYEAGIAPSDTVIPASPPQEPMPTTTPAPPQVRPGIGGTQVIFDLGFSFSGLGRGCTLSVTVPGQYSVQTMPLDLFATGPRWGYDIPDWVRRQLPTPPGTGDDTINLHWEVHKGEDLKKGALEFLSRPPGGGVIQHEGDITLADGTGPHPAYEILYTRTTEDGGQFMGYVIAVSLGAGRYVLVIVWQFAPGPIAGYPATMDDGRALSEVHKQNRRQIANSIKVSGWAKPEPTPSLTEVPEEWATPTPTPTPTTPELVPSRIEVTYQAPAGYVIEETSTGINEGGIHWKEYKLKGPQVTDDITAPDGSHETFQSWRHPASFGFETQAHPREYSEISVEARQNTVPYVAGDIYEEGPISISGFQGYYFMSRRLGVGETAVEQGFTPEEHFINGVIALTSSSPYYTIAFWGSAWAVQDGRVKDGSYHMMTVQGKPLLSWQEELVKEMPANLSISGWAAQERK